MKKNFKLFKIGIFLALILGFALGQDAYADGTWDGGAGDGLWNSAANWGGDALPAVTDDVVIGAGIAVVVDADDEVNSITLGAGSSLIDDGTARTLTIREDIDLSAANASITETAAGGLNVIMGQAAAANTPAITVASTSTLEIGTYSIASAGGQATTVTLDGNMQVASVAIAAAGTFNAVNGDTDTLTVLGNITMSAATATVGNALPPSLVIGDVTLATSTTSTMTTAADGDMIWADVTLYNAAVSLVAGTADDDMTIKDDLTLAGASTITDGGLDVRLVMNGGATQTITVSDDSYLGLSDLFVDGAATVVTTADDLSIEELDLNNGAFTQTAGTTYITAAPVYNAGTCTFNNLSINTGVGNITWPLPMTITGDFTVFGGNNLLVNQVLTTIDNSTAKEFVFSGGTITFDDLTLAADSRITTNSSFTLGDGTGTGAFTISSGASFNAGTGTITADLTAANYTLTNNGGVDTCLTVANIATTGAGNILTTATDLVITGNMTIAGAETFDATAGTVKFDNAVQKTLSNATGTVIFCNLEIADGSSLTTAHAFAISNNNAAVAAGITVGTDATLTCTASAVTLGENAENATAKTIVNNGTLNFFDLVIADLATNNVTTSSDFTIDGTAFTSANTAGGAFTATSSTITFTDDCVITADAAANDITFDNIICSGDADVTLTSADWIAVTGDITCNTTASFKAAANDAQITLNGTAQQTLGGNTSDAYPFAFGVLIINKSQGTYPADYVTLEADAEVLSGGTLTLTDGILDLGSQNFKVADVTVTSANGYINGNTGTYIVAATHTGIPLADALFTPDLPSGTGATLYNLTLGDNATGGDNETLDGDLTVNGDLELLGGDLTLGAYTLTVKGNLTQTTLAEKITIGTGTIQLEGTGTVSNLSNTLFTGSAAPNMIFKRSESLSGDLTFASTDLTMNCGTQVLDLGTNTLTFTGTGNPIIVSGQMDAGTATVVFPAAITEIPANIFLNDEVDDITIAANVTLLGNLIVNSDFQGIFDVTTGDNYLELASGATDDFTNAAHVIGNLRKTVTGATATTFPIGGGNTNDYRPVEILFATSTTSQKVEVSSEWASPVVGRAGDPSECINTVWTINPIGTVTNTFDSLQVNFGWGTDLDNGGLTVNDNEGFSARWDGSVWEDFRNSHVTGAGAIGSPASADGITMTTYAAYPLSSTDFGGTWAVFDPASAVDADKDEAIALADYKLVFTTQPTTAESGIPFNAVLQLQDQYGNPVTTTTALTVAIAIDEQPTATYTGPANAVIAANTNSVTVNGLILNNAGTEDVQLRASTTYNSATIYGTCDPIDILQSQPAGQGSMLTLSNESYTSMTVAFTGTGTGGDRAIVIAKAGSAITSDDFPVDGTSYIGNSVFGAGSLIGDAVVVFDGPAGAENPTFSLEGLAPGTTYYLRIFSYLGANGTENYNTNPGALSARSATTSSETDDDVAFGANDTRATAKPIGANSAVSGTIADDTDEDWFSFMVTSAASNVRVKLTGVPADYNLELYNADNRRVRRATLSGTESEYVVINNLDAGTYSIRIYGVDGAYSATPYTVEVQTRDTEIFSVTQ